MKKRVIDGTEEINRDVISTIKLRYELGDTLAKIIVNELDKIRLQFNMQNGDGYGNGKIPCHQSITVSLLLKKR